MELHILFLPICALLCIVVVGSPASSPAEMYWESMLPYTPIPSALQKLLPATDIENLNASLHTNSNNNRKFTYKLKYKLYKVKYKLYKLYKVKYKYKASRSTDEDAISGGTDFFLYNDFRPGKRMRFSFTHSPYRLHFLKRQVADAMPLSSNKLSEILNRFSVKPESVEADNIKSVIEDCEVPNMKGEEKYCATSLESLVDFVVSKLGKRLNVLSTKAESNGSYNKEQEYEMLKGIKAIGDKQVVCHKEEGYPYALFVCHKITPTKAFMVPLVGSDGSKVQALAICHMDSSAWSPQHYAFQVLKVKPGAKICHFLDIDTLLWVPN